jgi:hypothetical protein
MRSRSPDRGSRLVATWLVESRARGPRFAERIDLPFLLGTARTSDHTPAKPLGYVLHFLVGPAFAAQTLAAHLAYGTLVGGFFSLAG